MEVKFRDVNQQIIYDLGEEKVKKLIEHLNSLNNNPQCYTHNVGKNNIAICIKTIKELMHNDCYHNTLKWAVKLIVIHQLENNRPSYIMDDLRISFGISNSGKELFGKIYDILYPYCTSKDKNNTIKNIVSIFTENFNFLSHFTKDKRNTILDTLEKFANDHSLKKSSINTITNIIKEKDLQSVIVNKNSLNLIDFFKDIINIGYSREILIKLINEFNSKLYPNLSKKIDQEKIVDDLKRKIETIEENNKKYEEKFKKFDESLGYLESTIPENAVSKNKQQLKNLVNQYREEDFGEFTRQKNKLIELNKSLDSAEKTLHELQKTEQDFYQQHQLKNFNQLIKNYSENFDYLTNNEKTIDQISNATDSEILVYLPLTSLPHNKFKDLYEFMLCYPDIAKAIFFKLNVAYDHNSIIDNTKNEDNEETEFYDQIFNEEQEFLLKICDFLKENKILKIIELCNARKNNIYFDKKNKIPEIIELCNARKNNIYFDKENNPIIYLNNDENEYREHWNEMLDPNLSNNIQINNMPIEPSTKEQNEKTKPISGNSDKENILEQIINLLINTFSSPSETSYQKPNKNIKGTTTILEVGRRLKLKN